jgi:phosphatidylglycerol lysyltransferase
MREKARHGKGDTHSMANPEVQEAQSEGRAHGAPDDISSVGRALWRRRWTAVKRDGPTWLVAGVAFGDGLLEILRVLVVTIPDQWGILGLLPFGQHYWNRSLILIFGFALLYLSLNLFRRKRMAWWLAVASAPVMVLIHLGYGRAWYTIVTPVVMLGLLLVFRNRFTVRSEPRSIVRGLGIVAVSVVVVLAYGTAGFWLLDVRDFGIDFSLSDSFVRTLHVYTQTRNRDLIPHTHHAIWFLYSLRLAGLIVGGFAAYNLFRPLAYWLRTIPQERQEAKNILERYGTSSQDFFKLWGDKSYFFSEDRKSFIAYKVSANVAVALGDPVGPKQELEAITQAFVHYCFDNGWGAAFYRTLPELLPMYQRLGMQAVKIGEEAVVDLEHFCSQTARRKKYRWLKRKFEREGYFLTKHTPPHPQNLLDELEEVSEEWLSLPGRRERGFTLGSFDRDYLNETRLFVLRDAQKHPIAFVNEIPSFEEGEAALDLMRHRLEIPNATMDYLLIELLCSLKEEGFRTFNLGLAPLAGVGDRPGATIEEQALRQLYKYRNPFFSYKGLRSYKAKFDPNWVERFLVYKGRLPGLAKVGLALKRATEEMGQ